MPSTPLKYLAGLALLALIPVAVFLSNRSAPLVGLSLVSVVIIAASVYLMFGPPQAEPTH